MKRVVLLAVAATVLGAAGAPASAADGRNAAMAAGAIGGLAVGGLLGSALAAPPPVYVERPVYVARRPVYARRVYDEDEVCYTRRERVWVPGWGWERRRSTICD